MTRKGGRFINIGSKSFSIKDLEKMAEDGEADAIEIKVMESARLLRDALNQLLDEMAQAQSKRRGGDPDLLFKNYRAEIQDVDTRAINGKKRVRSVNVRVVNQNGSEFNLFDLLDAGTLNRPTKKKLTPGVDKPMRFPVYDGVLVEPGSKFDQITIGTPEVDPKKWVSKYQVKPIKPRNLYSRVRNSLSSKFKQVDNFKFTSNRYERFFKQEEEQNELNFYRNNLEETDRKVIRFKGLLASSAKVNVKLRDS